MRARALLTAAVAAALLFAACGPVDLREFIEGWDFAEPAGTLAIDLDVRGLAFAGPYAYVAGNEATNSNKLRVIDLSDPYHPASREFASGTAVYGPIAVTGDTLYVYRNRAVLAYDISDRWLPAAGGQATGPATHWDAFGMAGSGAYAYLLAADNSTHFLDVYSFVDPGMAACVASVNLGARDRSYGGACSLHIDGDLLVVVGEGLVAALSLADPALPEVLGSLRIDGPTLGACVRGRVAYEVGNFGPAVYDLRDPASPRVAGGIDTDTALAGLAVLGSSLYAYGMGELWRFSLDDPFDPVETGRRAGLENATGYPSLLHVDSDFLYVFIDQASRTLLRVFALSGSD
jgi:hypothetical protein